ncbi:MAG: nitrous oxide reductase family maturation protein NosD, partial [Chitinophagaceae bacterium]
MRYLSPILFLFIFHRSIANTIVVGKNETITSLRQGVKAARNGDTILLNRGVYKEGNIIIDKAIHLVGIDGPVLDGENKHEILTLTGKNIVIR